MKVRFVITVLVISAVLSNLMSCKRSRKHQFESETFYREAISKDSPINVIVEDSYILASGGLFAADRTIENHYLILLKAIFERKLLERGYNVVKDPTAATSSLVLVGHSRGYGQVTKVYASLIDRLEEGKVIAIATSKGLRHSIAYTDGEWFVAQVLDVLGGTK